MAIIIESPNEVYSVENYNNLSFFLGGSITDCPDWQKYVIEELKEIKGLTIYNPRRDNFPINDPYAAEEQIVWEFVHLNNADIIVMWFDKNSLGTIVLYELGKYVNSTNETIGIIGIDPEYKRKQDVEIQTKLVKPNVKFSYNLEDLINRIKLIVKQKLEY